MVSEGNVVLFFVLNMLIVGGSNYILDANGVGDLLEFILLPKGFVLILEGDDFLWIRILHDFGACFIEFGDDGAGGIVVLGHQTYFGLAEDERDIFVSPPH